MLELIHLFVCLIKKVYHVGEISAYSDDDFLYWSDIRLCIRSFGVYRDDICLCPKLGSEDT